MATDDWTPLPPLWPEPAASRTIGEYALLVFTEKGVPTWEVRYEVRQSPSRSADLITNGTADTFDAAKAAALHEASTLMAAKTSR
jgi:hypothetical protein